MNSRRDLQRRKNRRKREAVGDHFPRIRETSRFGGRLASVTELMRQILTHGRLDVQ